VHGPRACPILRDEDPSLAYGPLYAQKQATFGELAKRYDLPLIPFLLEGIAGNPA